MRDYYIAQGILWCSVVSSTGRKSRKRGDICMYTLWSVHFTIQQKLTQPCKVTKPQFKK